MYEPSIAEPKRGRGPKTVRRRSYVKLHPRPDGRVFPPGNSLLLALHVGPVGLRTITRSQRP